MVTTLGVARRSASQLCQVHAPIEAEQRGDFPPSLDDYLRTLQPFAVRQQFTRNETICREGDAVDHIYKVMSGAVRLCRFAPHGRRHITDFVLPGDLIGVLECASQPATAEAVSDTMVLTYPRAAFDRLAALDPLIRTRLLCHLSSVLLDAQRHLFVLGCYNAKGRVASFLLRLGDRLDVLPGERLDMPMGRQDMADHLGLTVETVCRAIASLKAEGAISVPNANQIVLANATILSELASEN